MKLMPGSERIVTDDDTNPVDGNVRWAPAKSLWIGTMTVLAIGLEIGRASCRERV